MALQYFAMVTAYALVAGLMLKLVAPLVPREYVFAGIVAWVVGFLALTGYFADGKRGVFELIRGTAIWFALAGVVAGLAATSVLVFR
jgi:hypothetical protein